MAQMCHWIVTNLTLPFETFNSDGALDWLSSPFSTKKSEDNGIQEIMPYLPPTPPPKTGYHRYVFVLLAPATEEGVQGELTKPEDRPHWGYGKVGAGVREWADENDLVAVGKQTGFDSVQDIPLMMSRCEFFLFQEQETMMKCSNKSYTTVKKDDISTFRHASWDQSGK